VQALSVHGAHRPLLVVPVFDGSCSGEVYQHSCRPERAIRMMAKAVVAANMSSSPGEGIERGGARQGAGEPYGVADAIGCLLEDSEALSYPVPSSHNPKRERATRHSHRECRVAQFGSAMVQAMISLTTTASFSPASVRP
jgi:hypothetical protein